MSEQAQKRCQVYFSETRVSGKGIRSSFQEIEMANTRRQGETDMKRTLLRLVLLGISAIANNTAFASFELGKGVRFIFQ